MNLTNPCVELRRESWLRSEAEGREELAESFATGRLGTELGGPGPSLPPGLALTGSRDLVS